MPDNSYRQRIVQRLINRADNPQQNLRILLIGIAIFLPGFVALVIAQFTLPDSLARELVALIGLAIAIIGAIVAAFGYISLSILWILRFLITDRPTQDDDR